MKRTFLTKRSRLQLLGLEARVAPAVYAVMNANDAGAGSLRQAVLDANATPGADTITFDSTAFALPTVINLTSGEININDALTITGSSGRLTIDAGSLSRHFNVNTAAAGAMVSLSTMTLSHGMAIADSGGAIFNKNADLTLIDVKVENNTAGLDGGGIYIASSAASLHLEGCTILNNQATDMFGSGGGLDLGNASVVTINRSSIVGNESGNSGGGISFYMGGSLTITDTTIWGNQANLTGTGTGGGGISIFDGTTLIRNCTIVGNKATNGGALLTYESKSIELDNCTLSINVATSSGGGIANNWGSFSASIVMESTIVADNLAATNFDINGAVEALGCLIENTVGAVITGGGNILNVDPMLGPLGANGGKTLTIELEPGSPAIDAGGNNGNLTYDQRGVGFARVVGKYADIGAFERQNTVVTNANSSGVGSLRQAVENANFQEGPDTITFDPIFFNTAKSITLAFGQLFLNEAVTITGPAAGVTIDAGGLSRHFRVDVSGSDSNVFGISNLTLINGNSAAGPGGSIYNFNESLSLTNVKISNNTTTASGGAIDIAKAAGSLTLTRCTLSSNTAGLTGGAISALAGGSVTIIDSTFQLNQASVDGGAVYLFDASTLVRNSTLVSNFALNGAAIAVAGNASLGLQNSTVAYNSASASGGGVHKSGTATVALTSTIVGLNSAPVGADIVGSIGANFSLLSTTNGGSIVGVSNKLNVNPLLATPTANGGPTLTCSLLAGSPAINTGSNPAGLIYDQRGDGYPRIMAGGIDIGAAERLNTEVINTNDSGFGSLRYVLAETNLVVSHDTVTFDKTVFNSVKTIALTNGHLTISDAVTIIGPNASLTLDAASLSRHFNIDTPGTGGHAVELANLRLINGRAIGSHGGSILNVDAALDLDFIRIMDSKTDFNGGAVALATATASLNAIDCIFDGNSASGKSSRGGAIFVAGASSVSITTSTVNANTSGQRGGGIDMAAGGTLTIIDSTISGNQANKAAAVHGGGGLYLGAKATFRNVTLSGNSGVNGGGIEMLASANLTVFNSTIAFNTASNQGGGIYNPNTGVVSIASTIVGKNQALTNDDVSGAITANFSLLSVITGATIKGSNNQLKVDPLLSSLSDNGGTTLTHAILAGSKAINAGSNVGGLIYDQRGFGFARVAGSAADIGAYETEGPPIHVSAIQINDGAAQRSIVTSLKVTFDQGVALPANPADAFQLYRQSDNAAVTLNATLAGNTVTLTFTGGAVDAKSLADGRYALTVLGGQIPNFDGNGDGTTGDNYQVIGSPGTTPNLFRLFGDITGDGSVAANDFLQFRLALGGTNSAFDFDNDGAVAVSDFLQFRLRFGGSI